MANTQTNKLLPKLAKIKMIKLEAVFAAILAGLSFILNPILGVFVLISKALRLRNISKIKWVSQVREPSIIEEILWVVVAVVVGVFSPIPIAIALVLWRAIMLLIAITRKLR